MSAYDNDPRVTDVPEGFQVSYVPSGWEVKTVVAVCPDWRGGWRIESPSTRDVPGFATADEAIYSLIGDPR
ncbi:hypothetical protein ACQP2Y_21255 [Actinoplanes sp. CA-051413]|uniref:hypothetical protein n=1 Tax=Actinoplanes sp. CA-051413 TaxID=3239899 RepID=UPI003D97BAE5